MKTIPFPAEHAPTPAEPLTERVRDNIFREPYTDELGRELWTAVTAAGVRLETAPAALGEVEQVLERLRASLDRARSHLRPLQLL